MGWEAELESVQNPNQHTGEFRLDVLRELMEVRGFLWCLEILRCTKEGNTELPYQTVSLPGYLQSPQQLTGFIGTLLKFSFYLLFFNHKLNVPCYSGTAWYWGSVWLMEEKTANLCVTFIVQPRPLEEATDGLNLEWKEFTLIGGTVLALTEVLKYIYVPPRTNLFNFFGAAVFKAIDSF